MYGGKKILGLITARGGSRGLPGKNILPLCGKPLIAWTVISAKKSRYIDRLVVSTDDRRIAEISRSFGAETPFLRPARLATSNAAESSAIIHALDKLVSGHESYDVIILLHPTSPLRTSDDIDGAIRLFFRSKAGSVISVSPAEHHPYWNVKVGRRGNIKGALVPGSLTKNRQRLPEYYRINGAIYISSIRQFRRRRTFFGPRSYAYLMPAERSVDIDGITDFRLAEALKKPSGTVTARFAHTAQS